MKKSLKESFKDFKQLNEKESSAIYGGYRNAYPTEYDSPTEHDTQGGGCDTDTECKSKNDGGDTIPSPPVA